MTKEEAIKILKSMSDISTQGEAIDMAIEALSAQQTDLISRADAIEAVMAEGRKVYTSEYANAERIIYEEDAVEALAMLPSADAVQVPDWLIEWSKDYVRECMKQLKEETQNDTSVKHSR